MADNEKQVREDEGQEISEKDMESVSGGTVIWPPIIKPTPTFPEGDTRLVDL
jgi:bacteriocin-like protein